jgi:hypothetical protein
MLGEWRIGKDVAGSVRGLILGTIPAFSWRDWEKPKKKNLSVYYLEMSSSIGPVFISASDPRVGLRGLSETWVISCEVNTGHLPSPVSVKAIYYFD